MRCNFILLGLAFLLTIVFLINGTLQLSELRFGSGVYNRFKQGKQGAYQQRLIFESYLNRPIPVKCSRLPPLTSINYLQHTGEHVLVYQKNIYLKEYALLGKFNCCYSLIKMSEPPMYGIDYSESSCNNLVYDVSLPKNAEFVKVTCSNWWGGMVYSNLHAFIGNKNKVHHKKQMYKETLKKKLSVLIVGVDSFSRMPMYRSMPETVGYLKKNKWFLFRGYNKIEKNIFVNMLAMLSGLSKTQLLNSCIETLNNTLDGCPFVWKLFSKMNYITAFGEEVMKTSLFHHKRMEFSKAPTDYYLSPFIHAVNDEIEKYLFLKTCKGPVTIINRTLNYSIDFLKHFNNSPSFSLFLLNLAGDDVYSQYQMDLHFYKYFKQLHINGVLNSTLVIFLNNHGHKYGYSRKLNFKEIEDKLPYIYFWVPEWFRIKYPKKIINLNKNIYKLVTPYDMHKTLLDVLQLNNFTTGACPSCLSVFDNWPLTRTCQQAGISNEDAPCVHYLQLSTKSTLSRRIALLVTDNINREMLKVPNTALNSDKRCSALQPLQVLFIFYKNLVDKPKQKEYLIVLQVVPGGAIYEATVINQTYVNIGAINRIDWHSENKCMNNHALKKFCFCVS